VNILFVHQNFPGQFKHLAPALAAMPGHRVVAMHINPGPPMAGVQAVAYAPKAPPSGQAHRWLHDLEAKVHRGEAAYRAARQLQQNGFTPDVIVAHPGWGESLFLKDVWPQARMGIYSEFYYHAQGADMGFDTELSPAKEDDACRLRLKNANYDLHFPISQAGLSPTHWQRSVFPEPFRSKISVMHDGIDTQHIRPNADVTMTLGTRKGKLLLTRQDEIITFVNRNLEPYRGYHIFMRALPAILKARPKARVLIVGGDGVSYGALPPASSSDAGSSAKGWRQVFLDEVKADLDLDRVHFLGKIPYADFVQMLQLSTVHVYLTYPFVLSWSLLEAMSAGCAIVASDTPPVREAVVDKQTGRLVDFFDVAGFSDNVIALCEDPQERKRLGHAAREFALSQYDLRSHCLPGQLAWVQSLRDLPV
jgi:glycosyltransferase involved in cell wall biosynthesis